MPRPRGAATAEEGLVNALVHSPAATFLRVIDYVDLHGDLEQPCSTIITAAVAIAQRGVGVTPGLIRDELRRTREWDRETACWLAYVAAQGPPSASIAHYANVVVARSARRRTVNWLSALLAMADDASETELAVTIDVFATMMSETFERLRLLRENTGG